jgi:hypothetical protein
MGCSGVYFISSLLAVLISRFTSIRWWAVKWRHDMNFEVTSSYDWWFSSRQRVERCESRKSVVYGRLLGVCNSCALPLLASAGASEFRPEQLVMRKHFIRPKYRRLTHRFHFSSKCPSRTTRKWLICLRLLYKRHLFVWESSNYNELGLHIILTTTPHYGRHQKDICAMQKGGEGMVYPYAFEMVTNTNMNFRVLWSRMWLRAILLPRRLPTLC